MAIPYIRTASLIGRPVYSSAWWIISFNEAEFPWMSNKEILIHRLINQLIATILLEFLRKSRD